jgi:hypothetical protein
MDYLVYVAFDAENLQFFLWYRDYMKRFNALPEDVKALSPEVHPSLVGDEASSDNLEIIQTNDTAAKSPLPLTCTSPDQCDKTVLTHIVQTQMQTANHSKTKSTR